MLLVAGTSVVTAAVAVALLAAALHGAREQAPTVRRLALA